MKFPYYKQLDTMDCGPSCLRMIAKYNGKSYTLQSLRSRSFITKSGVSMLGISDAAESIGFRTRGYRLTWEQLRDEVPLPCIVHWNQRHFVVVYRVKKRRVWGREQGAGGEEQGAGSREQRAKNAKEIVYVADPAAGLLKYTKDEFCKCWYSTKSDGIDEGTALLLEPTPEFYRQEDEEKSKLNFLYLLGYIRPYTKFILQLMLGMLTASIISLILPFLTQALVDTGIGNSNMAFVVLVLIGQLILSLSQTANGLLRNWISLHITSRISISLISDFLIKLMKLPISFFDVKLVGDIMQRIGDHNRIRTFLTDSLISIIFAVITLVMYTIIMATYHLGILGIFLLGSTLYIGWVVLFLKRRRELDYKRFQQSAANQSNIVQLVTGMQEIKLNSCEKQKRWEWERIQIKLFKVSLKSMMLNQNQQLGAAFINQAKDIFISFLSAKAVIEGQMTLGMMMAVQYIIGQLNAPVQQFIGFTQAAQDARISLERLGEIHNREDEEKPEDDKIREIPENRDIEIKNLLFQYEGPHSEKVLNNVSLTIPARKVTAIVGISGSGKTTLIKLMLGFYDPVKGDILLGGVSLKRYSHSEWRKRCGVVMQEGFIFSDSIAGNIGLIDEIPDREKTDRAVETANIRDYIEGLPLGYNTRIGNDGQGLSTGQKQRLLIARAVYKDPDFIFFDEATNALDATNERTIMENLGAFFEGKTVVIVAHRLSTVKNADQIIVLEKGEVAETGTHRELVSRKGAYFNLVKDQLELGG
ncbi:MAG TPA: peptidase domain-containing ABC transporter [Bacteroidales bacterium]|nr:peptidase domain-containing ABC transporter [Bacteroidales bacterium]HQK67356.1 peptidase domain-containing ABC transporter [Bacteroidales bacterium]